MKISTAFISLLLFSTVLQAQRQMNIQGDPLSSDTVASIKVNFQGPKEVVGLSVFAQPNIQQGIGGYFFGGNKGLEGHSNFGTGAIGRSGSGVGIYGLSSSASGVFGESTSGYGVKGQSNFSSGIYGFSTESSGVYGLSDLNVGVFGVGPAHVGVRGQSDTGIGVQGLSQTGKGVRGESTRIGVLGTSISTPIAIFVDGRVGVVGYSDDTLGISGVSAGSPGIGVQGLAQGYGGRGIVGLGPDSVSTGVWAAGSAFDFVAGGPGMDYGSTSSQRWKKNVATIESPLQKISALRGVSFDWDEAHGSRRDIGLIAEEVGKVIPEIVSYEENGIDAIGMDYSRLTPLLVEAVKALQEELYLLKENRLAIIKENEMMKRQVSEEITIKEDTDIEGLLTMTSGLTFDGIQEFKGTTSTTGNSKDYPYPSGYSISNTRILSFQIQFPTGNWGSSGVANLEMLQVVLFENFIRIIYPQKNDYQNRPFRILLLKAEVKS